VLAYDGKSEAKDKHLWTEKEYGDFVLMCDWKFPGKPQKMQRQVILANGDARWRTASRRRSGGRCRRQRHLPAAAAKAR
jgi:hypothetical protein